MNAVAKSKASERQLEIIFSDPPPDGSAGADKSSYTHRFKIPEPTNNVETLFRMLHAHLENFTSKSPIIAVGLKAETTKPSFEQFHLFETALRDPARLTETLARLTGLLGSERVGTPVLEETHRADACRMEPFSWQLAETKTDELPPLPATALRRFRAALPATALLDRTGVYGSQRFSVAAREHGVRPITGAELTMEDGSVLPVLVKDRRGYENLCELLTEAHLRSTVKGECAVKWSDLAPFSGGLISLLDRQQLDGFKPSSSDCAQSLIDAFGRENVYVEIQRPFLRGEERL